MMRLSRTAPLLVLALLLGTGTAAAQTIPSPYEHIEQTQRAGAFVGYLFLSPQLNVNDTLAIGVAPRSAPVVGVHYGVRVSGPIDFRTSLSVSPSSRDLWTVDFSPDSVIATPRALGESVAATLVMLDAGLRLGLTGPRTWNGFAPYIGASGGLVADVRGTFAAEEGIPEQALYRLGPSFALRANLGTDWFLAPRTSLHAELQGNLWRLSTPTGFAPLRATTRSEWNPGAAVKVGAAIHF
jgi:hypothetical protein